MERLEVTIAFVHCTAPQEVWNCLPAQPENSNLTKDKVKLLWYQSHQDFGHVFASFGYWKWNWRDQTYFLFWIPGIGGTQLRAAPRHFKREVSHLIGELFSGLNFSSDGWQGKSFCKNIFDRKNSNAKKIFVFKTLVVRII